LIKFNKKGNLQYY